MVPGRGGLRHRPPDHGHGDRRLRRDVRQLVRVPRRSGECGRHQRAGPDRGLADRRRDLHPGLRAGSGGLRDHRSGGGDLRGDRLGGHGLPRGYRRLRHDLGRDLRGHDPDHPAADHRRGGGPVQQRESDADRPRHAVGRQHRHPVGRHPLGVLQRAERDHHRRRRELPQHRRARRRAHLRHRLRLPGLEQPVHTGLVRGRRHRYRGGRRRGRSLHRARQRHVHQLPALGRGVRGGLRRQRRDVDQLLRGHGRLADGLLRREHRPAGRRRRRRPGRGRQLPERRQSRAGGSGRGRRR